MSQGLLPGTLGYLTQTLSLDWRLYSKLLLGVNVLPLQFLAELKGYFLKLLFAGVSIEGRFAFEP